MSFLDVTGTAIRVVSLATPVSFFSFHSNSLTTAHGSTGVVHAVAYSLLLLNTDLHVAELTTRMSRGQFVRNTLFTIQMQLRPSRSVQGSSSDLVQSERDGESLRGPGDEGSDVGTSTTRSRVKRSDSITSWNSITRDAALANLFVASPATGNPTPLPNDSTASVPASTTSATEAKTPSTLVSSVVYDRNWESDMESLLKVRTIYSCGVSTYDHCRICTMQSRASRFCSPSIRERQRHP